MASLKNKLLRKPLGLDDFFKFGQYKDEQVEDVLEDDMDYIIRLMEETEIKFDEKVINKIECKLK